jgi:hypothetical protein
MGVSACSRQRRTRTVVAEQQVFVETELGEGVPQLLETVPHVGETQWFREPDDPTGTRRIEVPEVAVDLARVQRVDRGANCRNRVAAHGRSRLTTRIAY